MCNSNVKIEKMFIVFREFIHVFSMRKFSFDLDENDELLDSMGLTNEDLEKIADEIHEKIKMKMKQRKVNGNRPDLEATKV